MKIYFTTIAIQLKLKMENQSREINIWKTIKKGKII